MRRYVVRTLERRTDVREVRTVVDAESEEDARAAIAVDGDNALHLPPGCCVLGATLQPWKKESGSVVFVGVEEYEPEEMRAARERFERGQE